MGSGFSKRKKQARLMQEQFQKMQETMQSKEISGESGSGLVSVIIDGEKQLKSISIKPDCVDREDIEGLQDLICAALQDAYAKLEKEGTPTDSLMQGLPFSF